MRSIDTTAIRNKHDMAHYRLVLSEALYHSRIDSDNDSLTRPMVDYYLSSTRSVSRSWRMPLMSIAVG